MNKDQYSKWRESQVEVDDELLLSVTSGRLKPEDIKFVKRKDALNKLGKIEDDFNSEYQMY